MPTIGAGTVGRGRGVAALLHVLLLLLHSGGSAARGESRTVALDSRAIDDHRCASDDGCQLNGLAYGSPPSNRGTGLASWGGSIVVDPVIIHATSASPLGPFIREEQVLGAFSHEPVVLTLPKEAGYVLYKIGCADNATTGSNGTWPPRLHEKPMVGRCHGCKNGVTDPSVACSHPDQVYERACQDVLFATSLDGPWQRQNLSGFERSVWPWNDVNLGLESHAPILLANGSVLTFTRAAFDPKPLPNCAIFTVKSEAGWNGTYEVVNPGSDARVSHNATFPIALEDTFMWQDPRGHFHSLFHSFIRGAEGGHGFSRDGVSWTFGSKANGFRQDGAYSLNVTLRNQTVVTLARRERPHLLLDAAGNPCLLTNGVQSPGFSSHSGKDWTYTGAFAIRTQ